VAKKIVVIVLGALAILVSLALIGAGTALFALFSPKGWIETGEHRVDTPTRALVSKSADFKDAADALNSLGDFRLRVRARASDPARALFIGVGPTAAVERYVGTFRHDRVTDLNLEPFHLEKRAVGTDGVPEPPSTQPFWVQRAEGTGTQILDWKIRDGSYEIVLSASSSWSSEDSASCSGSSCSSSASGSSRRRGRLPRPGPSLRISRTRSARRHQARATEERVARRDRAPLMLLTRTNRYTTERASADATESCASKRRARYVR
jgi:hypothetical protein